MVQSERETARLSRPPSAPTAAARKDIRVLSLSEHLDQLGHDLRLTLLRSPVPRVAVKTLWAVQNAAHNSARKGSPAASGAPRRRQIPLSGPMEADGTGGIKPNRRCPPAV